MRWIIIKIINNNWNINIYQLLINEILIFVTELKKLREIEIIFVQWKFMFFPNKKTSKCIRYNFIYKEQTLKKFSSEKKQNTTIIRKFFSRLLIQVMYRWLSFTSFSISFYPPSIFLSLIPPPSLRLTT